MSHAASTRSLPTMHEPDLEIGVSSALVQWGTVRLAGPGQLRLTSDAIVIEPATGETWQARYAELRGGGWRTGAIVVHGAEGSAAFEGKAGLDQAWALLVARTCPLPELTRAHRLLGSPRGGAIDQQARFLAPLLQARKRLEEVSDLDTRVAALDARALSERMLGALQSIAKDVYATSDPDRRAMEAELEEAMSPLFAGLDAMQLAAQRFRNAPESVRFAAWRDWVFSVSRVFALADNGWAGAARLFPTRFP
jgi:hypothetical protein